MANATNEASLLWTIDIDVFGTPKSKIGSWTASTNASMIFNAAPDNFTGLAQNDEVVWDVLLAKGTWVIEIMAASSTNRGIYTISLDGSSVGTQDWYSGSNAYNVLKSTTGVNVGQTKVYELKLKVETKNASSSNYLLTANAIRLRRTA